MKIYKIIAGIFLSISFNIANAQEYIGAINVSVKCYKTESLYEVINKEYKEEPSIALKSVEKDVVWSIWVNKQDKTWTLLTTKKDITCVVGMGKDFLLGSEMFGKFE